MDTETAATSLLVTVKLQVALSSPAETVIEDEPAAKAVTRPL
jgi:hypothetical protein